MRTACFTPRDFRLLIEDIKGQWDVEASSSGLTDYMKWKKVTEGDRIGFVVLQDFRYEVPSEPLPLYPWLRNYILVITKHRRVALFENNFLYCCAGPTILIYFLFYVFNYKKVQNNLYLLY